MVRGEGDVRVGDRRAVQFARHPAEDSAGRSEVQDHVFARVALARDRQSARAAVDLELDRDALRDTHAEAPIGVAFDPALDVRLAQLGRIEQVVLQPGEAGRDDERSRDRLVPRVEHFAREERLLARRQRPGRRGCIRERLARLRTRSRERILRRGRIDRRRLGGEGR